MRAAVPFALPSALVVAALLSTASLARADGRVAMPGATAMLPTSFEPGLAPLTVHALPRAAPAPDGAAVPPGWNQPLVDRRLDTATRSAPLSADLLETMSRIEPIYDPTLLEGPNVIVPMRISAGTAETRDLFGDHWRMASADANVDVDARPIATVWLAGGAPRPCIGYTVRRSHAWREPALTAPTAADCRAIQARQLRGFKDAAFLPIAIAAPPLPVFAAPAPGARMSSADFWAAQKARITAIRDHLHRKWSAPARTLLTRR